MLYLLDTMMVHGKSPRTDDHKISWPFHRAGDKPSLRLHILQVDGKAFGKNENHNGASYRMSHHTEHQVTSRVDFSELSSHTYMASRQGKDISGKSLRRHGSCEVFEDVHKSLVVRIRTCKGVLAYHKVEVVEGQFFRSGN